MRYLSLLSIPEEFYIDKGLVPEDIYKIIKFPDGVRKVDTFDDWYRRTFNILLESDREVRGITFPTALGNVPMEVGFRYKYGSISLVPFEYRVSPSLPMKEDTFFSKLKSLFKRAN